MTDVVVVPGITQAVVFDSQTPITLDFEKQLASVLTVAEQGPAGATIIRRYDHAQPVASVLWTVNHNLGFLPQVQALTVGGVVMLCESVVTTTQAFMYFDSAVAGSAVCS